jgi:transposase
MRNWPLIREQMSLVLTGKKSRVDARQQLGIPKTTWNRWVASAIQHGVEYLNDHRRGNNYKVTVQQRNEMRRLKKEGPWRSARAIRDQLGLAIHEQTISRHIADLMHLNVERLKPLKRFVADKPNDLWQTDIMGRMIFPRLGVTYLIAELDDHSRFILSSGWYRKQNKLNVFSIFYAGLAHWGKPKASLQDRGSQYKVTGPKGEADYSAYCRLLGIELKWAPRAQTKGKIERFWRFVQRDFVRENLTVESFEELNQHWNQWVAWYNFRFKRKILAGRTSWETYRSTATTKLTRQELIQKLTVEVRRKVSKESTISLAGQSYRIPPGYIGARIWVKILGNKVYFEAMGEIFWKQRLKV